VGSGNFNVSSIHYLLVKPGALERDEFIVDTPSVAHNLYLEVASELGIPGLIMLLLIVGSSVVAAVRAGGIFDRLGDAGLALIARGVATGLFSTMAADFFLSAEFSKQLWLLLALGPAALGLAMRMEAAAGEAGEAAAATGSS
jgi:O-antigen ligase